MLKKTDLASSCIEESGPRPNDAPAAEPPSTASATPSPSDASESLPPREIGGRDGPDPTRFGDWELRGRCIDF